MDHEHSANGAQATLDSAVASSTARLPSGACSSSWLMLSTLLLWVRERESTTESTTERGRERAELSRVRRASKASRMRIERERRRS